MKIDDMIAKHIGDLTLENLKLKTIVEALRIELAKKDHIIKELNEAAPEPPLNGKVHEGVSNGASAH